jgi:hypothetical protein
MNEYLAAFDKALEGLSAPMPRSEFHDSFEYYGATWTPDFFQQFQKLRGYDLRTQLPALFGEGSDDDTVARVKCDYRETLSDLHLGYIRRWTEWSHSNGSKSRNQAHGAPGNLIDLYADADIPETEIFGSIDEKHIPMHKMSSSAAHLTGRTLSSSESFTWLGEHFQVSLADVKPAADFLFLSGVNHILFHGIPYSPQDAPWPGWLFYAAVNFGPNGGLWHDLPAFNAYVARVQSVLQSGRPDNDVLLYWPVHDTWQRPDGLMMQFTVHDQSKWLWPSEFYKSAMELWNRGYAFDEVSDSLLAGAKVANGRIDLGGNGYRVIVVPQCTYIPVATMTKLIELAGAGATVIMHGTLPNDVPGFGDLQRRRDELHIVKEQIKPMIDRFRIGVGVPLDKMLSDAGVQREPMVDQGLRFVRRRRPNADEGCDYFIVNRSDKRFDGWVTLGTRAESAVILDPRFEDRAGIAALRDDPAARGLARIYLQLDRGESSIVRTPSSREISKSSRNWRYDFESTDAPPHPITGTWRVHFLEGGPADPADFQASDLSSWTTRENPEAKRFAGTARYTIEFDRPSATANDWLLDLGKVCESARVRLNGKDVATLWCTPFQVRVGSFLRDRRNTLELDVTNLAANRIADLDRRGISWKAFHEINFVNKSYKPFDASGWALRDSGLLGPVRLIPLRALNPGSLP